MAKGRTSSFVDAGSGLFNGNNTHEVQQVQEVQETQHKERKAYYGKTQGRKGMKLKRINMAFSDDNYEFITKESRRAGMSATAFVNMIIEEYEETHKK